MKLNRGEKKIHSTEDGEKRMKYQTMGARNKLVPGKVEIFFKL